MKKDLAKKVLSVSLSTIAEYDELLSKIKETCSDSEFKTYQKGFGKVMGYMFFDVMSPIFDSFPELKPPELNNNESEQ